MRRKPEYRRGDNLIVCDISGITLYQSESVKTWDGLRVHPDYWYPRHPQLDVKGIPETSQRVIDGRPEQPWQFASSTYASQPLVVASENNIVFQVNITNGGVLQTIQQPFQPSTPDIYLNHYQILVTDGGVLSVEAAEESGPTYWILVSPNHTVYTLTVTAGALTTAVLS